MRCGEILLAFCVILNLYQCRYTILQFSDVCLQSVVWFLTDAHRYIQQQTKPVGDIKSYDENNFNYNLSQYKDECPQHRYTIRVIERRPLIIYIEQLLTANEIQHLIELASPVFQQSVIVKADGVLLVDDYQRTSRTAYLGRSPTSIVKCIEQRFAQFQGDIDPLRLEPLQVVKYDPDQEFKPHFDWFEHESQLINGGQRQTTFFTYLHANCTKGETEFINVKFNSTLHSRFCKILVCDEMAENYGIRFRPIPGNSIFWVNIDEHGHGDSLTFHAGRPPGEHGQKLALNTWTRERIFDFPMT